MVVALVDLESVQRLTVRWVYALSGSPAKPCHISDTQTKHHWWCQVRHEEADAVDPFETLGEGRPKSVRRILVRVLCKV